MAGRKSGRRGGGRTGGHNRTLVRQEYSVEGSVPTEPEVNMHGTERTPVEEKHFTFEPEVKAALAREFTELMKDTLPDLLAEALKKANGEADPTQQLMPQSLRQLTDRLLAEGVRQAKGDEVLESMMWNDLKTLVIKNLCLRNKIEKVERELLGLKAGSMTHRQYTTRFNELARLVPHLVTTEERKIVCYIQGLPDKVRTYVKANAPITYNSVVELSGVVYDDLALNVVTTDEPKKKPSFPAKRSGGRLFGVQEKQARVGEAAVCGKCGSRHLVVCRLGTNLCYKYGKTGHYSRECMQVIKCYNCGEDGHMSRECTKPRIGETGKRERP
ncbi:hypothetical protein L1987_13492 [Smallanthus sonchifolius]|uniref:Uncharacterized protein n=1 Tax=Smallanthus sonchifolius TaxID=185202 RepID=A0ACB9JHI4_9ASTR|nr:hypothetical protein L1987_13492 [Smallanthus sonchifolius]